MVGFVGIRMQRVDCNVEEILKNQGFFHKTHYEIFRYVDDYFVFFNDAAARNAILKAYRLQLAEYRLHLNDSKIVPYVKPIITEITIAKLRIVSLLDECLAFEVSEASGNGDKAKISMHVSANRAITKFKIIVKETGVEYKDVLNYTLAIIEQKVRKILSAYRATNEGQIDKWLVNALLQILDLSFFLYSVSPRVNITIKLSRILRRMIESLNAQTRDKNDHKHVIFKSIYDNISFILRKNRASVETQVETLQLLIVLGELGKRYWLDDATLRLYFGIDQDDCGKLTIRNALNYFSIVVLLFYMKDKRKYNELRDCLCNHILRKFHEVPRENIGKNTELVLLLFDVIACPYLSEDFKRKVLSLHGVARKVQTGIIDQEEDWFTGWTDFDFGEALDAKRSREVY